MPSQLALFFWVAAGGALGSAARHAVNVASQRLLGNDFPWGTLTVNVAGSFAMGVLAGLFAGRWLSTDALKAFLTVGLLGGFTTFSAYSLDFALLVERRALLAGVLYAAGSVGLSIAAVFLGMWLARAAPA
jgi:CrcB protein